MYTFENMTKGHAVDISFWQYGPPYDMYSLDGSEAVRKELLEHEYYAVMKEGRLIGYFCVKEAAQVPAGRALSMYEGNLLDVGIGMRPDVTGEGRGAAFFEAVLSHIETVYAPIGIRLTVAAWNARAIRLYEKMGFRQARSFYRGNAEFYIMIRSNDSSFY
ncbi:MAG: GNAT family N-acetyltransferase [Ectobacillus sp.]